MFPSKVKCEDIDMKISFYSHANETNFHNKVFALSLVLKVTVCGTRKWLNDLISHLMTYSLGQ